MTYFNRSREDFSPVQGSIDSAGLYIPEGPIQLRDGLYYRSRIFPALQSAVQDCVIGEREFNKLPVDAYQSWVETGWKEPHASLAAVSRFRQKGIEEAREVEDAYKEFMESKNNTHLVEELGDYAWVTVGFANNGGVVTSDSIKTRLYDYGMGTKIIEDGKFNYPVWYDTAMRLAIKRNSLTLGDIDDLNNAGFMPRFSPAMNVYQFEDQICSPEYVFDLSPFAVFMAGINEQQYDDENRIVTGSQFMEHSNHLGKLVAESIFRVAAIAHKEGSSFSEVVRQNVIKISGRIETGTVDRSDGKR
jgi:hypothetical protein